ncbi:MAG: N-6 DNA methylase, partial [Acetobacteraceae bacterium]|nr:N-6 DNA methylase [Acetobacteraceae bacterium]
LCALLTDLEDDGYWRKFGITNFLEGDVFSWYADERSGQLASAVQSAAGALLCFEPATPLIKPDSVHDLLKEFYTTLVDEAIRHDLGEYYTPDWLAQRVLNAAGYTGDPHAGVLDPACGSGTFLVECINRIRRRATSEGMGGQEILSTLLHRVKGMDLNPLAVISARANFILSIADLVSMLGDGAELPIYLADCITVPLRTTATDDLAVLAFSLDTELGWYEFQIPANLIEAKRLREVLLACEDAVRQKRSAGSFLKAVRAIPGMPQLIDDRSEKRLVALFEIAASLEQPSGHRIWARIVNTSLSADGFVGQVDLLVGNAPWVRWSRLPRQYRERVKDFGKFYGLVAARGYSGGIEADISTLVLFSAADHWLKSGGRIGFLMTWSVFKSASAGGFRQGVLPNGTGLRMDGLADLRRVLPFPDATNETAIYVATKVAHAEAAAFEQVSAETWLPKNSARIDPRSSLDDALDAVDVRESVACPVGGWGSPLWTGETREFQESRVLRGCSAYLHRAHRGTVTDLARVYWVKVERYAPDSGRALIRTLSNAELARAQKIDPVEGAWIEAELLFPLIRGRDLGRYCFRTNDFYQLIPNAHYESVLEEEVFAEKYPCAYAYLSNYRDLLVRRATYQRYQAHLPFYVIYCIGSYSFRQWKLAWMEQQDPAAFRCAVISDLPSSVIPNRRIIADHKLYFADLDTGEEAHYLAAFLNSHPVRTWLGGFLHAKQIATSIFEFMHVPRYDETDADHRRLAALSLAEHGRRAQALNTEYLAPDSESELADLVRRVADRAR